MKTNVKIDALRELRPFEDLSAEALEHIASLCDEVIFDARNSLMSQGAAAWECFLVVSGLAEVHLDEVVVGTVGPGEFVGEMSLLHRAHRSASVVAVTPVRALVFASREFTVLLDSYPSVYRHLARQLTDRLRSTDQLIRLQG